MHFKPKQIINISFTGLIVLLALPASTVLATWNSQPDDTLYPIKRGLEKTALAIIPQSLIETKLQFAFLERRTQEASIALIQKPNQKEVLSDIVTQAQVAQTSTTTLKSKDQQITASLELIEKIYQTSEELDQVKNIVADSSTPTLSSPQPTFQTTTPPTPSPYTTPTPKPKTITPPLVIEETSPPPVTVPSQPTPQTPTNSTTQPITQTQQEIETIANQLEQQLENENLNQDQQKQFETIKRKEKKSKLKRPQPISDETVEKYKGVQCWSHARNIDDRLVWMNGCRGRITNGACTMAIVRLSESELNQYRQWISNGKPDIPGCHPTNLH